MTVTIIAVQTHCHCGKTLTKIAVLVDVQNIYYTTRQIYAKQFNYRKLWEQVGAEGEICIANAYAIERGDEKQKKFQSALRHLGFTVKLKPYIQRGDGSAKGDWDVGITIDAMESVSQVDKLVLLSGDGDFALLLETLKSSYGIKTEVFSVRKLTANALIDAADKYSPIESYLLL